MKVFLCGDVMTGRGVDQILPHPSPGRIHESSVQDARTYVELAELSCGTIPSPVSFTYVWGDALAELDRVAPDARIINLETSVTRSEDYWRGKEVHYRMHPDNVACLTCARVDVCALANNHVLDYGYAGLGETLDTLHSAGLKTAGAGRDLAGARRPAAIDLPGMGRLLVFAFASETSGVPRRWAARKGRAGVDLLRDLSETNAGQVAERARGLKRPGDIAIASIHWGSNWGYEVYREQVRFAHALIDGGFDLVHGHSSHHVRPIEVYENKLVLYGCGDFIDDYEGITGEAAFRSDLVLMYFATLAADSGDLTELRMTPMQIRKMRLNRASPSDAAWLRDTLCRTSAGFGTRVDLGDHFTLALRI
jgi:poly-gamma-glutamate capsule biosynthesis protein CapA/YwtB (metallophosphatase superfamily)